MTLDQIKAIPDAIKRAKAAEDASRKAEEYGKACDKIRDDAFRAAHAGGKGQSYGAIADAVGVSKSTVASACNRA